MNREHSWVITCGCTRSTPRRWKAVLEDDAVVSELRRIKELGVSVGLTVTGPHQSETIERAMAVGPFDTVEATWNLLERSAGQALSYPHAAGRGVIVKEPLANGRLTAADKEQALLDTAREDQLTPDVLAVCRWRK